MPWVNAWEEKAADVHDLGGPFDEGTYCEYLHWFHGATCVCCFPVPVLAAPHKPVITDTFVIEPLAAFHALVSKFVNYLVLSLIWQ